MGVRKDEANSGGDPVHHAPAASVAKPSGEESPHAVSYGHIGQGPNPTCPDNGRNLCAVMIYDRARPCPRGMRAPRQQESVNARLRRVEEREEAAALQAPPTWCRNRCRASGCDVDEGGVEGRRTLCPSVSEQACCNSGEPRAFAQQAVFRGARSLLHETTKADRRKRWCGGGGGARRRTEAWRGVQRAGTIRNQIRWLPTCALV